MSIREAFKRLTQESVINGPTPSSRPLPAQQVVSDLAKLSPPSSNTWQRPRSHSSDLLSHHSRLLLAEAVNALADANSSTDAPAIADLSRFKHTLSLHVTSRSSANVNLLSFNLSTRRATRRAIVIQSLVIYRRCESRACERREDACEHRMQPAKSMSC